MTVCDDCFWEFVHPLFHELMDKNERFEEQYGSHAQYDWDDEAVTLTFSDPILPAVRIDVTVVGSTEGNSWEWSWANSNYGDRSKLGIEKVRQFGEANGYENLTSAFGLGRGYRVENDRSSGTHPGCPRCLSISNRRRPLLSRL